MKASAGDEVVMPGGTCTWNETLVVDRSVHLRGSGPTLTVLRDNVPKGAPNTPHLISVEVPAGVRLSKFTVEGVADDTLNNNYGYIYVEKTVDLRIDHVIFRQQKMPSIVIRG